MLGQTKSPDLGDAPTTPQALPGMWNHLEALNIHERCLTLKTNTYLNRQLDRMVDYMYCY